MRDDEWMELGRRLRDACPEDFETIAHELLELATVKDRRALLARTGSTVVRAILAPPRTRESR